MSVWLHSAYTEQEVEQRPVIFVTVKLEERFHGCIVVLSPSHYGDYGNNELSNISKGIFMLVQHNV